MVSLALSPATIIVTILNLVLMGLGIYTLFLVIKALRIYIKKNSK
ncbi:hypothetical protein [Clostridium cylindrosporum]|uniref:Uncharacterized protein n=1 Tax=Clostridium cylindrosporum DSM 605 TaxID=1121307 RepID=A0A0J8G1Z7_CLOCY|nr:hypothetical protein [Clostridium cylindrosporum]KMT21786.1 hypothetical protein CLCY_3c00530 [Clostridium cylindrosporum DSM 605]